MELDGIWAILLPLLTLLLGGGGVLGYLKLQQKDVVDILKGDNQRLREEKDKDEQKIKELQNHITSAEDVLKLNETVTELSRLIVEAKNNLTDAFKKMQEMEHTNHELTDRNSDLQRISAKWERNYKEVSEQLRKVKEKLDDAITDLLTLARECHCETATAMLEKWAP